jgi:hypothetical protein
MTFTKIAVVCCLVLLGFVSWLAVAGFGAAREGLICLVALVLLVGGGNLLSGRSGHHGRRQASVPRDPVASETLRADASRGDDPPPP